MALYPWRLQGDIKKGEIDPMVTVFLGPERSVMDDNGEPTAETFIEQNTKDPVVMKLSELVTAIGDPAALARQRVEHAAVPKLI